MSNRVLVTMPRYTPEASLEASRAFFCPVWEGTRLQVVDGVSPVGSLLPHTFNECWALALNLYQAGDLDLFAMIHADVEAQPGWLDTLHAEMDASGADLVSAVVSIKDKRGLTSTGVDDTGDRWSVRRLTLREVFALPETFTSEHVGAPLLVNTGLWLCRLGAWALDVSFEIESTIRNEGGRYVARCVPEDWAFSRRLHSLGRKLAATRKVEVNHWGPSSWSNTTVRGWDTDRVNRKAEAVSG